jgi:uncharacterized membrane protein YbhN (UPF0104 family)
MEPDPPNKSWSPARIARISGMSLVLLGAFVAIFRAGSLPLLPPPGALDRLNISWLLLAALSLELSILLKYARYHFLVAPLAQISFGKILNIGSIAGALILILPLRLGEFSRPALLREKGKVSGWNITGTVAAERLVDGVLFGFTLLAGLAIARPQEPLPDRIGNLAVPVALVPKAAQAATVLFGGALLVMALLFWKQKWVERFIHLTVGRLNARWGEVLAHMSARLVEGARFLPKPGLALPYLFLSWLHVATHGLALVWGARAVGFELSFVESMTVTGVLALGFALPNAPGFFGAIQLALYAGMGLYVDPNVVVREGAAVTFFFYVGFVGFVLLNALIAAAIEYGPWSRARAARAVG